MKTETIEYKDGDVTLRGYLAYDETKTGKRPGILVMPEALGLGTHAKSRAERLAQLGYVALAGDPYGGGRNTRRSQKRSRALPNYMRIRPRPVTADEPRSTSSLRSRRSIPASLRKSVSAWVALSAGTRARRRPAQRRGDLPFRVADPKAR